MHRFRAGAVLSAAADKLSQNTVWPGAMPGSPATDWSWAPTRLDLHLATEETKPKRYKTFRLTQTCV